MRDISKEAKDMIALLADLSARQRIGKGKCRAYAKLLKWRFGNRYKQIRDELVEKGLLTIVSPYSIKSNRSYTYALGIIITKELLVRGKRVRKSCRGFIYKASSIAERLLEDSRKVLGLNKISEKGGRIHGLTRLKRKDRPELFSADLKAAHFWIVGCLSGDESLIKDSKEGAFYKKMAINKPDACKLLFSNAQKYLQHWEVFASLYPVAAEWLLKARKTFGCRSLALHLHSLEGRMLVKALSICQIRPTPFLSAHDCIKCTSADDAQLASDAWASAGRWLFNQIPGVSVERG